MPELRHLPEFTVRAAAVAPIGANAAWREGDGWRVAAALEVDADVVAASSATMHAQVRVQERLAAELAAAWDGEAADRAAAALRGRLERAAADSAAMDEVHAAMAEAAGVIRTAVADRDDAADAIDAEHVGGCTPADVDSMLSLTRGAGAAAPDPMQAFAPLVGIDTDACARWLREVLVPYVRTQTQNLLDLIEATAHTVEAARVAVDDAIGRVDPEPHSQSPDPTQSQSRAECSCVTGDSGGGAGVVAPAPEPAEPPQSPPHDPSEDPAEDLAEEWAPVPAPPQPDADHAQPVPGTLAFAGEFATAGRPPDSGAELAEAGPL
ncbi:hypothetical protein [Rhodococcus sp. NPDC127528]|uniref:hypothetical protein n=1 Tax=unclassified Rhodococcus (in: high G+C Gram-positive bacteria) TaxID=192944 RepID=UPI003625CB41